MLKKTLIITLLIFIAIQFIRVDKTNPPVNQNIALNTSIEVMDILKNSCYDCHSFETKWPYYSEIAPVSFFVVSHVNKGRKALNFSEWKNIDTDIKEKRLKRAIMTVNNGMMALPSYVSVHDNAKLNKEEKTILIKWLEDEITKLKKI